VLAAASGAPSTPQPPLPLKFVSWCSASSVTAIC
jgi:hypothetical protein